MARDGAFEQLALELIRDHYDPRYEKTLVRQGDVTQAQVTLDSLTPDGLESGLDRIEAALARLPRSAAA